MRDPLEIARALTPREAKVACEAMEKLRGLYPKSHSSETFDSAQEALRALSVLDSPPEGRPETAEDYGGFAPRAARTGREVDADPVWRGQPVLPAEAWFDLALQAFYVLRNVERTEDVQVMLDELLSALRAEGLAGGPINKVDVRSSGDRGGAG